MTRFYQPDLSQDINSPFIRGGADKLVRRTYWLDMDDRTLVMVMVNGIGANLTNDEAVMFCAERPMRQERALAQLTGKHVYSRAARRMLTLQL